MISTLALLTVIVTAIASVASLALILGFLWRVYERGGRIDLSSAARALRQVHNPNWTSSLLRLVPAAANEPNIVSGAQAQGDLADGPDDGILESA